MQEKKTETMEPMDYYIVKGCDCVSNVKVFGLEDSVRAAKYPMAADLSVLDASLTNGITNLAQSDAGSGHDNWLNGVVVQFDLTFTNKAWVEAERYHFLDFVSSQSTMHRITKFDLDKAYIEYVDDRVVEVMKELVREYNILCKVPQSEDIVKMKQKRYLSILYTNPAGFRLTARMTTDYRQLKTIYHQRKDHRLPEWRMFCRWIETLPFAELITGGEAECEQQKISA